MADYSNFVLSPNAANVLLQAQQYRQQLAMKNANAIDALSAAQLHNRIQAQEANKTAGFEDPRFVNNVNVPQDLQTSMGGRQQASPYDVDQNRQLLEKKEQLQTSENNRILQTQALTGNTNSRNQTQKDVATIKVNGLLKALAQKAQAKPQYMNDPKIKILLNQTAGMNAMMLGDEDKNKINMAIDARMKEIDAENAQRTQGAVPLVPSKADNGKQIVKQQINLKLKKKRVFYSDGTSVESDL